MRYPFIQSSILIIEQLERYSVNENECLRAFAQDQAPYDAIISYKTQEA